MIGPFRKKYRILSHLAFWLCIFGMFMLTGMFRGSDLKDVALLNLALLPMDMAAAYTVIYLIIPRFLFRKRYLLFFLFFFAFTIAYVSLVTIPLEYYLAINYYEADKWGSVMEFARSRLLWSLVILTMINGLAASVKITKHWLLVQNEKQQVEKEKFGTELKLREAELRFLRSQMHPHFLFNTLNNLYGLTLEKSDLASEVVVKLSEMLDYMLYECNENLVPLDKELKLLDNYIALERIRHEEEVDIRIEVKGPASMVRPVANGCTSPWISRPAGFASWWRIRRRGMRRKRLMQTASA